MAKGKYQEWLEPEKLTLLQGWAGDGLNDEQISHNMGISPCTLYDWKKKYPEISEAIKKGKEVIDYEIENALVNKALLGDVTAAIFLLKHRRPEKYGEGIVKSTVKDAEEDDPITAALKAEVQHGTQ